MTTTALPASKLSRGSYLVTIVCDITLDGPMHVGTGERLSVFTDAPLLRDGSNQPVLPGSSVRGVLRDWCEREAALLGVDRAAVVRLFGSTDSKEDRQGRLVVREVPLDAKTSVRDNVSIDRVYGAAKEHAKFDREVAEAHTAVVTLIYEGDTNEDEELQLLSAAVSALERGVLAFGGHTGSGFGSVRATNVRWNVADRRSLDGLAAYCLHRLPRLPHEAAMPAAGAPNAAPAFSYRNPRRRIENEPEPWAWLSMLIALQFDGPMLTAAPIPSSDPIRDESKADATYLTDAFGRPVLPGSSIRGVLRSYAERIAATLDAGRDDTRKKVADVVERLFGRKSTNVGDDEGGQQGLLRVGEGCLPEGAETQTVTSNHVAIDRVTGFAVDKRLFNDVALASPRFLCRLSLRWHAFEELDQATIALLLINLRDIEAGLMWLGSRTTRGYGHVAGMELSEVTVSPLIDEAGVRRRGDPRTIVAKSVADLAGEREFSVAVEAWKKWAKVEAAT